MNSTSVPDEPRCGQCIYQGGAFAPATPTDPVQESRSFVGAKNVKCSQDTADHDILNHTGLGVLQKTGEENAGDSIVQTVCSFCDCRRNRCFTPRYIPCLNLSCMPPHQASLRVNWSTTACISSAMSGAGIGWVSFMPVTPCATTW